jgi:hypothetical protein
MILYICKKGNYKMKVKCLLFFWILFFGVSTVTNAQYEFSHEIGVFAGPVSFQSDYGARNDLSTAFKNSGYGVGLIHYVNFSNEAECNCYTSETYFNDHFKLRSELSYSKTELRHSGRWVEGNPSLGKDQLLAMRGSTALANLGMQLEFFPWSIRDFTSQTQSWAPFISFGGQFSFYDAKANSTMGPLGTPITTFPKFLIPSDGRPYGFSTESRPVWSIVSSVGTRYKLGSFSDLMIDLRLQYYFSNWVDGLHPNPEIYRENKARDWLVWFNVGYIYYL